MKVVVLQASPNEDGLTATFAEEALQGAQAAGAETELFHLCQLHLLTCQACEQGWGQCRREGTCVLEDDLAMLVDKMVEAEALILSTPVYFGEVAEVFKSLFDRVRRCQFAGQEERRLEGKWVLNLAAAGGGGGGGPTCLVSMERYAAHMGMRIFDQLIATRRNREYLLPAARQAGEALVRYLEE